MRFLNYDDHDDDDGDDDDDDDDRLSKAPYLGFLLR